MTNIIRLRNARLYNTEFSILADKVEHSDYTGKWCMVRGHQLNLAKHPSTPAFEPDTLYYFEDVQFVTMQSMYCFINTEVVKPYCNAIGKVDVRVLMKVHFMDARGNPVVHIDELRRAADLKYTPPHINERGWLALDRNCVHIISH